MQKCCLSEVLVNHFFLIFCFQLLMFYKKNIVKNLHEVEQTELFEFLGPLYLPCWFLYNLNPAL